MNNRRFFMYTMSLIILSVLAACSVRNAPVDTGTPLDKSTGKIYLYGEQHGVEKILEKELELWNNNYNTQNMRHLFVEYPYYTAEFLNLWMQSDSDDILDELYKDWEGTASHNPNIKEFYKKIKRECPETIFHGTDVGHQYNTTGQRFLKYLEENNLQGTEMYLLTQDAIEQGNYYYKHSDDAYRENKMVENFIREFDRLKCEDIMGIYGGAHTDFDAMGYKTDSVPCMANQLKKYYSDSIYSEDLTWLVKDIEPIRVDDFTINHKNYKAYYFGKQDLTGFKDYTYREFWRLENAYEDFQYKKKTGDVLPYDNYPMLVETKQVYVIDVTKKDGSVIRMYYRSDGYVWNGLETTEEFTIE
ncbi:hypothetical protein [Sedimentibacter sp. B4]|uniref:hypothetical protein n=1 Tax=Sedimentibacter sp. B4 TaxID=304766 RepID=UPI0002F93E31|nr:hypothetical protein [Sedimentibacter sp. B4]